MLCIVVIQEATTSPLVAQVTPAWLATVAQSCALQLTRDVAPVYGGSYAVRVGASPADVQPGEMVFAIVDALPDAPGAVAYHDVAGADVPVAFLALSTCNTLPDVSTAISHELCETAGDEACDLWADDGQGSEWAREICDAVESNFYEIAGVVVSDFLLPGFFAPGDPGPYNFCATGVVNSGGSPPLSPFATSPNGYQIKRASGTGETIIQGSVRALRQAKVDHWSSRTTRRGAHR